MKTFRKLRCRYVKNILKRFFCFNGEEGFVSWATMSALKNASFYMTPAALLPGAKPALEKSGGGNPDFASAEVANQFPYYWIPPSASYYGAGFTPQLARLKARTTMVLRKHDPRERHARRFPQQQSLRESGLCRRDGRYHTKGIHTGSQSLRESGRWCLRSVIRV